jgi:hypothetical protein
MVLIYLIEDINDLRYVGSTKQKLNHRLSQHKSHNDCSSSKLNLHNCIITELERCDDTNKKEREQYWIDRIDCVNKKNAVFDRKEYNKEYREKNKEAMKEYSKEYLREYRKLDWYCPHCRITLKIDSKANHLKSQKHQLNINNYIE